MKRTVSRIVLATALVGLGWVAGHAQATNADFELAVSSPNGSTTITCNRGCGLQFIRMAPDKAKAEKSFTYECSSPSGRCGGTVQGWITQSATMAAGAQTRPIFTGLWKFVADQSLPPDRPALGKEFRLTHDANALTLEVPMTQLKKTADGKMVATDAGLSEPFVYTLDGGDHVALPLNPMVSFPDGSSGFNYILGGPYRATWSGTTLVIAGSDHAPYTSVRNGTVFEAVRRQISTRFSINPDGSLLVERTMERDPADKGQIEIPKAAFRSLYRKAP